MKIACLFLFIFATLVHHSAAASCGTREGEYIWDASTNTSLPTNVTEFQENLNGALDQLPTNVTKISLYGWAGVFWGEDLNAAYTEGRCIGYVDFKTCQECIEKATQVLRDDCSEEATSAFLWYGDDCMVRYSNHHITGIMQMPDEMIRVHVSANSSSSPISYEALSSFFNALAVKTALLGDYQNMLAAGKWYDSSSKETIYGVAQCSWALSSKGCTQCLAIVGQNLEKKLSDKVGGSIVGPSCNFRYEVYPFMSNTLLFVDFSQPAPPPPPPPSPLRNLFPPSPRIFNSPPTGKGSSIRALPFIYILVPFFIISIIW